MIAFLFQHEALYKPHLQLAYNPPEAALNAKLQVKSCTDKIPIVQRKLIAGVLVIHSFSVHRDFCSAEQPGRQSRCCSVGAQEAGVPVSLLAPDRVRAGHRVDDITPEELYLGCTEHLGTFLRLRSLSWGLGYPE